MFFSMAKVNDIHMYIFSYLPNSFTLIPVVQVHKSFVIHIFTFKNVKLCQNNQTISNMDFFFVMIALFSQINQNCSCP